ncbi:MAG TPA: response regulator, partial [Fodinibius sp.]|nr:response regulator [Fodinibius sp.]
MGYRILVIDDDEIIHVMCKSLLGKEFDLLHARSAQEGIDIISEQQVNLILTDIHMPGLSGLDFLESLMKDARKSQTPVLIITNLPTVKKEKKALNLGAADFLDKELFIKGKKEILRRVRMKLVTHLPVNDPGADLASKKQSLINKVMFAAIKHDFTTTLELFCGEVEDQFDIDYIAFWASFDGSPDLLLALGREHKEGYTTEDLLGENAYQELQQSRKPYLTNHVDGDDAGTMANFSQVHNLPAEIGVPLYAVAEKDLLMNNMQIPESADLYGIVILKRNKLFSTREFNIISKLLT